MSNRDITDNAQPGVIHQCRGFRFTDKGTRFIRLNASGRRLYVTEPLKATVFDSPSQIKRFDPLAGIHIADEMGEYYCTEHFEDVEKMIAQVYNNELRDVAYYTRLSIDDGKELEEDVEDEIISPTKDTFCRLHRIVLYDDKNGFDIVTDYFQLMSGKVIVTHDRVI